MNNFPFLLVALAFLILAVVNITRWLILWGPKDKRDSYWIRTTAFYRWIAILGSLIVLTISIIRFFDPERDRLATAQLFIMGLLAGIGGIFYKKILQYGYKVKYPENTSSLVDEVGSKLTEINTESYSTFKGNLRITRYLFYCGSVLCIILSITIYSGLFPITETVDKNKLAFLYLYGSALFGLIGFIAGKVSNKIK